MPELERDLREVGRLIAFPPEPNLVPGVVGRLTERPQRRRRPLVLALAVLAVALAAAFAVNGADGLWIHGADHVIFYFDSLAIGRSRVVRLAGDVLVWAHGSVTLRLEGPLSKAEALRIARSVR